VREVSTLTTERGVPNLPGSPRTSRLLVVVDVVVVVVVVVVD
jgi:hypothetical protein